MWAYSQAHPRLWVCNGQGKTKTGTSRVSRKAPIIFRSFYRYLTRDRQNCSRLTLDDEMSTSWVVYHLPVQSAALLVFEVSTGKKRNCKTVGSWMLENDGERFLLVLNFRAKKLVESTISDTSLSVCSQIRVSLLIFWGVVPLFRTHSLEPCLTLCTAALPP